MHKNKLLTLIFSLLLLILAAPIDAALVDQVNQAYRQAYGKNPTVSEWTYWAGRVQRKEKTTYSALVGAMFYQKSQTGGSPATSNQPANNISAASGFVTDKAFYPSSHNPNFLPEGTLVTSPSTSNIYYIRGGKKSWVSPNILARWFNENHFFKGNIVINISDSDLARYPTASSVNKLYVGKILIHPNGSQFFIDDKLRKRAISASVRTALKIPGGNAYPVSAPHIAEFKTGPALTADKFPGGFTFYDGPYHGGRLWKTEEIAGGIIVKRLYLKDRFYEADGQPDESQRASASAAMLARHPRGKNIDAYPDGWVIAIGNNVYVMQGGRRRLISSASVLSALGYNSSIHIRREYPDLFGKLAQGQPIRAFKSVTAAGAAPSKGAPAPAPSTTHNLTKIRPALRSLIAGVNDDFRFYFDKDPSTGENKAWVDAIYAGEYKTKGELIDAMQSARNRSQTTPARTNKNAAIDNDVLMSKWFDYIFYFVHQKEPSQEDRNYWSSRSDKNTINSRQSTMDWLKGTTGQTRR